MLDTRSLEVAQNATAISPIIRVESLELYKKLTDSELRKANPELAAFYDKILTTLGATADNVQVQVISDDENQFVHYGDRVNSLYDGAIFLINTNKILDETIKEKLRNFLREKSDACIKSLLSISTNSDLKLEISHYQNILAEYSKYVLEFLRSELNMPIRRKGFKKHDELLEHLSRAEEFALAKKSKPAIATISSLPKKSGADSASPAEYMAMVDKPEDPFSDLAEDPTSRNKFEEDLKKLNIFIKAGDIAEQYGYEPPDWWAFLSIPKQKKIDDIFENLNFNDDHDHALIANAVKEIAFPTIKTELYAIQVSNTLLYPQWYKALKDYEKDFLQAYLKDINLEENLGSTLNAISSKLRLIPAPSNYGTHTLITHMKSVGQAVAKTIVHPSQKRSSHIASRDVRTRGENVRKAHARRNVHKMLDDLMAEKMQELNNNAQLKNIYVEPGKKITVHIPILYQTLITPLKFAFKAKEPDYSLNRDKKDAVAYMRKLMADPKYAKYIEGTNNQVEIKFDLISTNHPLNVGKYLIPTSSGQTTGAEIAKLLSSITGGEIRIYGYRGISHKNFRGRAHLETLIKKHNVLFQDESPETKQKLKLLTDASITLARMVDDKRLSVMMGAYRELYISSLEQIVASLAGGGSIGSCVSGKDRKALEIAHTDAMKIFYERFGYLPPPNPPIRIQQSENSEILVTRQQLIQDKIDTDEFAKIFAEIYCTKHQQALAGQNAPGSFGTKTPGMYLPEHLKKAVTEWYKAHDVKNTPYEGLSSRNIMKEDDRRASNNEINKIKSMFAKGMRLLKIFRKKPKMHLPSDDEMTWAKNKEKEFSAALNDEEFKSLNSKVIAGLVRYESEKEVQAKKTGFFSHSNDAKKDLMRAHMVEALLGSESSLTEFQKNVLLLGLINDKTDVKLQHIVIQAMPATSIESARRILSSNIKQVINEYLDNAIQRKILNESQRKTEYEKIQKDINSVARDALSRVKKNADANYRYKEGTGADQSRTRKELVSDNIRSVTSILVAVEEKDPHRAFISFEQSEDHARKMRD